MAAVAIYVDGLVKEGKVGWAFFAPEVGHSDYGWVEGTSGLMGRYRGTLEGLNWAQKAGYSNVLVHSSDPVFVDRMLDGFEAGETHFQELWIRLKEIEEHFQRVVYFSVSAEENPELQGLLE